MRSPIKLEIPFKKMDAHKIRRTMDHFRDTKKKLPQKKNDSVQFLLNSFYPINYLGIPKVGRREATSQQQVTKNTEL